ncbi:hypothetical protein V5O48_011997 [Marasmius crinis-equi]|uniref:Uncharacterized protein n=1 Tax=Marasmius crinis-equi TaxID=585013 RepID=A0ABR3F404_9AGAR
MSQNFGDTISDGIQDVSALLPLLGTEQCERHVGAALEKGYIYAAATPLSIFGSLGIVSTAFATFLATTTRPFYGSSWLDDAGFGSKGSAISMAIIAKGTKQYGAEVNFQRLLKEQHIDDPDLVSQIDWFGWRNRVVDGEDSVLRFWSWNSYLILTSTLSSLVSLTPYLYLIHDDWGNGGLWLFPLLRSVGSLLCVVSIQLALQHRIHRITTSSLLLLQARKYYPLTIEDAVKDNDALMEMRLRSLYLELRSKLSSDPEKRFDALEAERLRGYKERAFAQLSLDVPLLIFQISILAGMGMIVAGYVGCFNLVSRTNAAHGPYVWLGMETFLSVLRMILWGWNPTWDEGNTGLVMRLGMRSDQSNPSPRLPAADTNSTGGVSDSSNQPNPPTQPIFPLITTPHHFSQLSKDYDPGLGPRIQRKGERESFIAESAEDFLAAATPYVGPLRQLALEGVSLFFAVVPELDGASSRKLLCVTVRRDDSKWASISLFIDGSSVPYAAFSSYSRDVPGTQALQVTLGNRVIGTALAPVPVIDRRTIVLVAEYASSLFGPLFIPDAYPSIELLWTVTFPLTQAPARPESRIPLTKFDEEYMRFRQSYDLKCDYCFYRGQYPRIAFTTIPAHTSGKELSECAIILESAILEISLCVMEQGFVQSTGLSLAVSRRLELEWVRKMDERISFEKEDARSRRPNRHPQELFTLLQTWDVLARELRSLRQLGNHNPLIQTWVEVIAKIFDPRRTPDDVSRLFELQPLASLSFLRANLLPALAHKNEDGTSPAYGDAIALVRTSLWRFVDNKRPSLSDRIHPFGPGSPEFSPPFTRALQPAESTLAALSEQIDSVQVLEAERAPPKVLVFLDSLPHPLPALTTLILRDRTYEHQVDPLTRIIPSVLEKHHNIICLSFEDGDPIAPNLIEQFKEAITRNRQRWRREAQERNLFAYTVGIQLRPSEERSHVSDFKKWHRAILMTKRTEIFALVHIPEHGKIVPTLTLRVYQKNITIIARLVRLEEQEGSSDPLPPIPSVKKKVPIYGGFQSGEIDEFPAVPAGCYELHVRVSKAVQYLFEKLAFEFVPSASQPTGEPSVQPTPAAVDVQSSSAQKSLAESSSKVESGSPSGSKERKNRERDHTMPSRRSASHVSSSDESGASDADE